MILRRSVLAGSVFWATALAAQQQPPVAPPATIRTTQQQPPVAPPATIRTTTRLVQVSCVIEGKKGAQLAGLTAADFQLFDKGVEQQIAGLSVGWSDAPPPAPALRPAGYFTNRTGLGWEQSPSATVILISHANLPNMDERRSKEHILKFLATLQPWERVALYTLEDGLRVLHDFSSDPAQLQAALQNYQPVKKKTTFRTGRWQSAAFLESLGFQDPYLDYQRKVQVRLERQRALGSVAAIEAIARRMAGFPGRKNLVWVTDSVPFELPRGLRQRKGQPDPLTYEVHRLARALQDADISVYPVNPSGIEASFVSSGYDPWQPVLGDLYLHMPNAVPYYIPQFIWYDEDFTNERSLADRTGGKAFIHSNNLAGALRRALNDARRTYVLGFYPSHSKWDGSFRKLKVKLLNQPGWKPRCRQGYYALPDFDQTQPLNMMDLVSAAASPLEAAGLPLEAHASVLALSGGAVLLAQIRLAAQDVPLQLQEEHWTGSLIFLLVEQDVNGRMIGNRGEILEVQVPATSFDQLQQEGLRFTRGLKLANATATVRIVLKEPRGNQVGSLTLPVAELPLALARLPR